MASSYDADFTHTRTGELQRARVHAYLARRLEARAGAGFTPGLRPSSPSLLDDAPGLQALELGCGTGEDALFLARAGAHVLATDVSPAMLAVARAKTAAAGLTDAVRFEPLDLRALETWETSERFDLVFSNFGALNCLSPTELGQVGRAATRLLRPGGHAVLVVMPRFCAWEFAYFALRLRLGTALRRVRGGPVSATLGSARVATWYHSPAALRRAFGAQFRRVAQVPVGLFLPPSNLDRLFSGQPGWLAHLDRLERRLGHGALAGLADHCLVDLELRLGQT